MSSFIDSLGSAKCATVNAAFKPAYKLSNRSTVDSTQLDALDATVRTTDVTAKFPTLQSAIQSTVYSAVLQTNISADSHTNEPTYGAAYRLPNQSAVESTKLNPLGATIPATFGTTKFPTLESTVQSTFSTAVLPTDVSANGRTNESADGPTEYCADRSAKCATVGPAFKPANKLSNQSTFDSTQLDAL